MLLYWAKTGAASLLAVQAKDVLVTPVSQTSSSETDPDSPVVLAGSLPHTIFKALTFDANTADGSLLVTALTLSVSVV